MQPDDDHDDAAAANGATRPREEWRARRAVDSVAARGRATSERCALAVALGPCLLVAACLLSWPLPAAAGDWDRRGWYVGVGGGAAFDFLDDYVEDQTGGLVDFAAGGSFNLRGGYRAFSWLAIEGMYEGLYDIELRILGSTVANTNFHSLVGNVKLIAPIWRTQPYLAIGPGAQSGNVRFAGSLETLNVDRWDFMLRVGFGLDAYIDEHWLLNFEIAPSVRFTDWIEPTEATDNVSLTVSGGVQYRF